jgi:GNAT superfamily N-acetyltransferase
MSLATHANDIGNASRSDVLGHAGPDKEHCTTLRDGTMVSIRPLHAGDRPLETEFIRDLSPASRRQRFLCDFKRPSEALIDQMMDVDHDRREALIAVAFIEGSPREVGVARYCAVMDTRTCECAVTVADAWQHQGLGKRLMRHLIDEARVHGFTGMISVDAASNHAMRELAASLGFQRRLDPRDPSQVIHSLDLLALPS